MPIRALLTDTTFNPEAVETLAAIYEEILATLGITREHPSSEPIAVAVITAAKIRGLNRDEIRELVLSRYYEEERASATGEQQQASYDGLSASAGPHALD